MRDARQDGLVNVMTGLGDDEVDLQLHTTRTPGGRRSAAEYREEWRRDPMARREVSQVAGDMFRRGLTLVKVQPAGIDIAAIESWIEGDTTPDPDGSIDRSDGLLYYAQKVIETGDKVGGAALYPIMQDGLDPIHPLDWRRIHRVVGWEVLDRDELIPFVTDGMGTEPEYWMLADVVAARREGERVEPLRVGQVIHRSRLWIHKGVELDRREERLHQWWGDSELELNWDARRAVATGTQYANTYLHRSSWLHYSLAELNELYSAKEAETNRDIGVELIDERMRQFRRIAGTMGIALSDGGRQGTKSADGQTDLAGRNPDKVESVVERTGDLVPIVQLNMDRWQQGFGAPRSIAFGERASALQGGKNEGDWQSWEGTIGYKRKVKRATGLVNWMLTIVFASRCGPTRGLIPTQWEVFWRPLIVPTPMENAEIDKERAAADNERIRLGVAKAEEVRDQRLVQGDVEGQLKAVASDRDLDSAIQPAQVGVAKAILEGAMAVASDQVSEEFYAGYLQAIDRARFPGLSGEDLAAKAAKGKKTGQVPMPDAAADGGSPVSAATLMSAGGQVAQGKLAPEFLAAGLHHLDPENYTPEVAASLTAAALGGSPAVEPVGSATSGAAEPTVDAEPAPAVLDEDEAASMPEPDPIDALLAEIPADLMTPEAIVADIKARTGLDVSTQRVHALAKKHGARSGKVGAAKGFSAADIKRALARENGLELPSPPVDPEPPTEG